MTSERQIIPWGNFKINIRQNQALWFVLKHGENKGKQYFVKDWTCACRRHMSVVHEIT